MTDEAFDNIVSGFYDAASGQRSWTAAFLPLQRELSSVAVYLHAVDLTNGAVVYAHEASDMSPEANLDYIRTFHEFDPRVPIVVASPQGHWLNCWDHFDEKYVAKSKFYQDFLIPYGGRYVSGTKVFEDKNTSVIFGVHRSIQAGKPGDSELVTMKRLARHLTDALRHYEVNAQLHQGARIGLELVERIRAGVIILDEERRIICANGAAQRLMNAKTAILERGGRLHCSGPKDDVNLAVAIAKIFRGKEAERQRGVLRAHSKSAPKSLGLCLSMLLPKQTMYAFADRPLAMVVIHEPSSRLQLDPFVLAATFDLTPAEARVAVAAAQGSGAEEIAVQNKVSPNTVRSQLQSIFLKTSTSKHAELVSLLAGLAMTGFGGG